MSTVRLRARVPSAVPLFTAVYKNHRLAWHKQGTDGSAKCDACYSPGGAHQVIGVVFSISLEEKRDLDRIEGLGVGYSCNQIRIEAANGVRLTALTYQALRIGKSLKPYHWYKEHVLRGAREHLLPDAYIRAIESVESIDDPQTWRHATELGLYA